MTGTANIRRDAVASARPTVLIGSLSRQNPGPIPTVTAAFMEGLADRYLFIPHYADRRFGNTRTSGLNLVNGYYLLKHYALWCARLLWYRPAIAHYPVTSFWNLEKSMLFLRTAEFFGARTVGHLHGGAFLEFWQTLSPRRKKVAAARLLRLDAMVALSAGWKRGLEMVVGLDPSRVHVVGNPIDKELQEAVIRLTPGRESGSILALGVMGSSKGVFDILEAARLLPRSLPWTIDLAGPEREPGTVHRCRILIAKYALGDRVTLRGPAYGSEKARLFTSAGIFLLPSYVENLPLVILEAAAAGLPIVTTPVGAIPEHFHDGGSFVAVQAGDTAAIAGALERLLRDGKLRCSLGSAAREVFIRSFARDHILASLDAVYRSALEGGIPAPLRPGRVGATVAE